MGCCLVRIFPAVPDSARARDLPDLTWRTKLTLPFAGPIARDFFVQAQLPNTILSTIWNLADTQQQGSLTLTEFIVAMHLLFSYKQGAMTALPQTCPPALFDAATRMVPPERRNGPAPPSAIPRQFSGEPRTSSPANRQSFRPPQAAVEWAVTPHDKGGFDTLFDKVDVSRQGFITGSQAYDFLTNSELPQETLAQIWELATIRKMDQLNRDEFAVAMYLMQRQRGKTRPDLPAALPPNLIPPALRSYAAQPASQSMIAPATGLVSQAPQKSAADDLFGLDEVSSPSTLQSTAPPQQQQTTGGSASRAFSSDPFGPKASASPTSASFQPPRGFKSFIPTSSFGQSLQQQDTGGSGTSSSREVVQPARVPQQQPSAMDDLLGDADPEVSKRLTSETAELANMSNQIGQLRTQMQEVQTKSTVTESEINRTSTQKRDLELRLAQFRQQYEQEIRAVKALDEQLQSLRSDTQKVSRDLAMVEGTFQDLQTQHRQATTSLESERRENASLRERMAQVSQEIARMRPDLEKLKSDTRHEKGMVSISKKQLEKSEAERDSMKSETGPVRSPTITSPPSQPREASNVVSPAASVQSQSSNPFFRKTPQPSFDNSTAPSAFARSQTDDQGKFGSIWGSSFASSPSTAAPLTSFGGFNQKPESESSEQNEPTPSASPPASSYRDWPRAPGVSEIPEPRQLTSNDLPMRGTGAESSTSMRAETPSSRWDGAATPTAASTASPTRPSEQFRQPEMTSTGAAMFDRAKSTSPVASNKSDVSRGKTTDQGDIFRSFPPAASTASASSTIPGAFPGSNSSPLQSNLTGESSFTSGSKDTSRTETFSTFSSGSQPVNRTGTSGSKGDFDAAFASLGGPPPQRQPTSSSTNGAVDPLKRANSHFPPIEINEEDSEDSEPGFDDDFTAPSPQSKRATSGRGTTPARDKEDDFTKPRTAVAASPSDLPPITAQKSPPSYEQTTATSAAAAGGAARDSNSFPPEFTGLLPQRESAATAAQAVQSPSQGATLFGGGSAGGAGYFGDTSKPTETPSNSTAPSGDYHSAVSQPSAAATDKSTGQTSQTQSAGRSKSGFGSFGANDDFDSGFDDLEDAKADDGKDDDDFFGSGHDNSFDEFNPSFDSPAASKSNTLASEFDSSFGNLKSSTASASTMGPPKSASNWDDLMKGIDNPSSSKGSSEFLKSSPFPDLAASGLSAKPFGDSSSRMAFPEAPEPPKLGRALSEGTEHDDPILKHLTAMGYDRNLALDALEKYDYNLDKVQRDRFPPRTPTANEVSGG